MQYPLSQAATMSSDTSVFIAEFPKTSFTLGLLLQRFLGRSRKYLWSIWETPSFYLHNLRLNYLKDNIKI